MILYGFYLSFFKKQKGGATPPQMLSHKFGTADYVILIFDVKLVEIAAPTPNANDEIFMRLGVLLRIEKNVTVDGVELKLMPAEVDESLYKSRYLFDPVIVAEGIAVYLHGERAAVDDLGKVVFCEGLDAGERSIKTRER